MSNDMRKGIKSLRGLTFSDVLILPERTDVRPDQVDLASEILPSFQTGLPVWSAPMTSVWAHDMTVAMAECGALAPIHRDLYGDELKEAIDKLAQTKITKNGFFQNVKVGDRPPIIVATSPFDEAKTDYLIKHSAVDYVIFDTVQPYSSAVLEVVGRKSVEAPNKIIVGNVATADAAADFARFKIAALKVGLGPGSICTTRSISGVGVPQMEAIQEVAKIARPRNIHVIADGGIQELGDIAKALAAGATSVMMGNIFAGTKECAGERIEHEGRWFKKYVGSHYGSVEHCCTNVPEIDDFFAESTTRIEGAGGLVPYKGSAKVILFEIKRALGASMAFVGAKKIPDFQEKVRLIKVSPAAHAEGHAHSLHRITDFNRLIGKYTPSLG